MLRGATAVTFDRQWRLMNAYYWTIMLPRLIGAMVIACLVGNCQTSRKAVPAPHIVSGPIAKAGENSTGFQYSINLLWINRTKSPDNELVFPRVRTVIAMGGETQIHTHFDNLTGWAEKHPDSVIRVWYDSSTTTPEAVSRTLAEVAKFPQVKLNDLNELGAIKSLKEKLGDDYDLLPVYFKVDLAKLIVTHEILAQDPSKLFVFSDFDLEPLSQKDLFDDATNDRVQRIGFVFTERGNRGFENSFHIFRFDDDLQDSLDQIIQLGFSVAKIKYRGNEKNKLPAAANISPQLIYDLLGENFFVLYYAKKSWLAASEAVFNKKARERTKTDNEMIAESMDRMAYNFLYRGAPVPKIINIVSVLSDEICHPVEREEKYLYLRAYILLKNTHYEVTTKPITAEEEYYKITTGQNLKIFLGASQLTTFFLEERIPEGVAVPAGMTKVKLEDKLKFKDYSSCTKRPLIPGKAINHTPSLNY
jgi:hypothetical protein